MSELIAREVLERCRAWIAGRWGLQFEAARENDLLRGLIRAASALNCSVEELARRVGEGTATMAQQEILIAQLTVGETYFWREKSALQALQTTVLPALIAQRRRENQLQLRLWSAGCCSGEEAYSLAILLHQLLPDLARWQITLAATDLNPQFLTKARAAIYSAWSFRAAPRRFRDRYFDAEGHNQWRLQAPLAEMVDFFSHNLASAPDARLHHLDVILCRNVLIYFSETQRQNTIDHFYAALRPESWLVVGPSETSQTLFARFATVNFPGAVFYQKPPASTCSALETLNPSASTCSIAEPLISTENPPASTCSDEVEKLAQRARALADAGELAEARRCCEKALESDKMRAETYCLYAAILQEQNALADAAQALRRALYLDHDCIAAHFALGQLARRNGKPRDAQRHFANARQLLERLQRDEIVPEAGGLSAAELLALLDTLG